MADQDRNSGSKQADGNDESMNANPADKKKEGSGGVDGSSSKAGSESGGYTAGSKNKSEEADTGEDLSGESGAGKSGSTIR
jgi:hypothetical protein